MMTVGVSNIGNDRGFLGISVQDGGIIPKINVWSSLSILYPSVLSLQTLEQRYVGLKKSQLVASF